MILMYGYDLRSNDKVEWYTIVQLSKQVIVLPALASLFAHFLRDEKVPVGQENFANLKLNVAINLL